jgi:hypothetical protein
VISIVVYGDRDHVSDRLDTSVDDAIDPVVRAERAAKALAAADPAMTAAIVRFDSDLEFLVFESMIGRHVHEKMRAARLVVAAGASFIAWSNDASYADGCGWRGLYTRGKAFRAKAREAIRNGGIEQLT